MVSKADPPLPAQLRSQEDFDYFINSRNGDPWNMAENPRERARLDASLAFISRYLRPSFRGTFLEGGCFNGYFTKRLLTGFPFSEIIANDISAAAITKTRNEVGENSRVTYVQGDISALHLPRMQGPSCLVLLESIYYMAPEERGPALAHLIQILSRPLIFISGPIHGTSVFNVPYLREADLFGTLRHLGYKCSGKQVLNFVSGFKHGDTWLESARTQLLLQNSRAFRERWAHQVIYCFRPKWRSRRDAA